MATYAELAQWRCVDRQSCTHYVGHIDDKFIIGPIKERPTEKAHLVCVACFLALQESPAKLVSCPDSECTYKFNSRQRAEVSKIVENEEGGPIQARWSTGKMLLTAAVVAGVVLFCLLRLYKKSIVTAASI